MKPRQFDRREGERRSNVSDIWDQGCGSVYVLPVLGSLTLLESPEESDAFEYSPNFDAWIEEFWN